MVPRARTLLVAAALIDSSLVGCRENVYLGNLVAHGDASADIAEHVRRTVHAALDEAGVTTPMRVEVVGSIEREGHAAKLKLIKQIGSAPEAF